MLSYAQELRHSLRELNQRYAQHNRLPHCLSYGEAPTVAFEPFEADSAPCHGNFLPATYAAILADPKWRRRLEKPHSQARRSLPSNGRRWMELDSSSSSDALLMNVFCYPRVFSDGRVLALLGVEEKSGLRPEFGFKAHVPLMRGKFDRTEVDMRLGNLLVEAKLTESDFQTKAVDDVARYRDFADVFEVDALPRCETFAVSPIAVDDEETNQDSPTSATTGPMWGTTSEAKQYITRTVGERYVSYQLIRNVLAAHATGAKFCVIHDARRPDLREAWYAIMRCVKNAELRTRCQVLSWQELASVLPAKLQGFLDEKYGIAAD
ncbi:MAG: hypothetical protein ACE14L_13160 [Terriglobales bacterium]